MKDIKDFILEFSKYGKIEGEEGINRVFGSEEYSRAAKELKKIFESLHLDSYIDSVGNVHGIYRAGENNRKELMLGSHLDTVKNGGMFDGLLGIAAGLFCIQRLIMEKRRLKFDLHLVASNGEEGNELGGTFGSRCMIGAIDVSAHEFMEKAKKYDFSVNDILMAKMDFSSALAYLELHIEQGNCLINQQKDIGVVTGIVGLERYAIEVNGIENHSGTTAMSEREDALVRASNIIVFADELAKRYPDRFVATFSRISVESNALAVINRKVNTILEIRSVKKELMKQFMNEIKCYCREKFGDDVSIKPLIKKKPVQMEETIVKKIKQVCCEKQIDYMEMVSGATHDGNIYAEKIPVGMIFVPSRDGISHSGKEWTNWEQCELGAEVLYQTILKINF